MYESFYKFTGAPFSLTPDHRFFFKSAAHKRALAHLKYGLHQAEGFILVTGDVGCGKTTLISHLMDHLDPKQFIVAKVVSTNLNQDELLRMIAVAFGIDDDGLSKASLLYGLEYFAEEAKKLGRRCLIFIDEAQNLSQAALEEVRMLSNITLGDRPAFQGFLIGQPELRKKLADPSLEQLRQRIIASYHLGPLGPKETALYVLHRLRQVGWQSDPEFSGEALKALHKRSGGIPRRINGLCTRALLAAALDESHLIDEALILQVADDLEMELAEDFEPETFEAEDLEAGLDEPTPSEPTPSEPAAPPQSAPVASPEAREVLPAVDQTAPLPEPGSAASPAVDLSQSSQRDDRLAAPPAAEALAPGLGQAMAQQAPAQEDMLNADPMLDVSHVAPEPPEAPEAPQAPQAPPAPVAESTQPVSERTPDPSPFPNFNTKFGEQERDEGVRRALHLLVDQVSKAGSTKTGS